MSDLRELAENALHDPLRGSTLRQMFDAACDPQTILALLDERDALRRDAERLLFVSKMCDGIGDIDFHEEAAINASAFGRDEPNDADYIAAVRTAIDAALAKGDTP